ncbi:unnamed protein product [Amoebophrya sp. A120]|nr:unnamed protein product [Amoebophrya sp. A120]|eukprot:GSA120T00015044001.1
MKGAPRQRQKERTLSTRAEKSANPNRQISSLLHVPTGRPANFVDSLRSPYEKFIRQAFQQAEVFASHWQGLFPSPGTLDITPASEKARALARKKKNKKNDDARKQPTAHVQREKQLALWLQQVVVQAKKPGTNDPDASREVAEEDENVSKDQIILLVDLFLFLWRIWLLDLRIGLQWLELQLGPCIVRELLRVEPPGRGFVFFPGELFLSATTSSSTCPIGGPDDHADEAQTRTNPARRHQRKGTKTTLPALFQQPPDEEDTGACSSTVVRSSCLQASCRAASQQPLADQEFCAPPASVVLSAGCASRTKDTSDHKSEEGRDSEDAAEDDVVLAGKNKTNMSICVDRDLVLNHNDPLGKYAERTTRPMCFLTLDDIAVPVAATIRKFFAKLDALDVAANSAMVIEDKTGGDAASSSSCSATSAFGTNSTDRGTTEPTSSSLSNANNRVNARPFCSTEQLHQPTFLKEVTERFSPTFMAWLRDAGLKLALWFARVAAPAGAKDNTTHLQHRGNIASDSTNLLASGAHNFVEHANCRMKELDTLVGEIVAQVFIDKHGRERKETFGPSMALLTARDLRLIHLECVALRVLQLAPKSISRSSDSAITAAEAAAVAKPIDVNDVTSTNAGSKSCFNFASNSTSDELFAQMEDLNEETHEALALDSCGEDDEREDEAHLITITAADSVPSTPIRPAKRQKTKLAACIGDENFNVRVGGRRSLSLERKQHSTEERNRGGMRSGNKTTDRDRHLKVARQACYRLLFDYFDTDTDCVYENLTTGEQAYLVDGTSSGTACIMGDEDNTSRNGDCTDAYTSAEGSRGHVCSRISCEELPHQDQDKHLHTSLQWLARDDSMKKFGSSGAFRKALVRDLFLRINGVYNKTTNLSNAERAPSAVSRRRGVRIANTTKAPLVATDVLGGQGTTDGDDCDADPDVAASVVLTSLLSVLLQKSTTQTEEVVFTGPAKFDEALRQEQNETKALGKASATLITTPERQRLRCHALELKRPPTPVHSTPPKMKQLVSLFRASNYGGSKKRPSPLSCESRSGIDATAETSVPEDSSCPPVLPSWMSNLFSTPESVRSDATGVSTPPRSRMNAGTKTPAEQRPRKKVTRKEIRVEDARVLRIAGTVWRFLEGLLVTEASQFFLAKTSNKAAAPGQYKASAPAAGAAPIGYAFSGSRKRKKEQLLHGGKKSSAKNKKRDQEKLLCSDLHLDARNKKSQLPAKFVENLLWSRDAALRLLVSGLWKKSAGALRKQALEALRLFSPARHKESGRLAAAQPELNLNRRKPTNLLKSIVLSAMADRKSAGVRGTAIQAAVGLGIDSEAVFQKQLHRSLRDPNPKVKLIAAHILAKVYFPIVAESRSAGGATVDQHDLRGSSLHKTTSKNYDSSTKSACASAGLGNAFAFLCEIARNFLRNGATSDAALEILAQAIFSTSSSASNAGPPASNLLCQGPRKQEELMKVGGSELFVFFALLTDMASRSLDYQPWTVGLLMQRLSEKLRSPNLVDVCVRRFLQYLELHNGFPDYAVTDAHGYSIVTVFRGVNALLEHGGASVCAGRTLQFLLHVCMRLRLHLVDDRVIGRYLAVKVVKNLKNPQQDHVGRDHGGHIVVANSTTMATTVDNKERRDVLSWNLFDLLHPSEVCSSRAENFYGCAKGDLGQEEQGDEEGANRKSSCSTTVGDALTKAFGDAESALFALEDAELLARLVFSILSCCVAGKNFPAAKEEQVLLTAVAPLCRFFVERGQSIDVVAGAGQLLHSCLTRVKHLKSNFSGGQRLDLSAITTGSANVSASVQPTGELIPTGGNWTKMEGSATCEDPACVDSNGVRPEGEAQEPHQAASARLLVPCPYVAAESSLILRRMVVEDSCFACFGFSGVQDSIGADNSSRAGPASEHLHPFLSDLMFPAGSPGIDTDTHEKQSSSSSGGSGETTALCAVAEPGRFRPDETEPKTPVAATPFGTSTSQMRLVKSSSRFETDLVLFPTKVISCVNNDKRVLPEEPKYVQLTPEQKMVQDFCADVVDLSDMPECQELLKHFLTPPRRKLRFSYSAEEEVVQKQRGSTSIASADHGESVLQSSATTRRKVSCVVATSSDDPGSCRLSCEGKGRPPAEQDTKLQVSKSICTEQTLTMIRKTTTREFLEQEQEGGTIVPAGEKGQGQIPVAADPARAFWDYVEYVLSRVERVANLVSGQGVCEPDDVCSEEAQLATRALQYLASSLQPEQLYCTSDLHNSGEECGGAGSFVSRNRDLSVVVDEEPLPPDESACELHDEDWRESDHDAEEQTKGLAIKSEFVHLRPNKVPIATEVVNKAHSKSLDALLASKNYQIMRTNSVEKSSQDQQKCSNGCSSSRSSFGSGAPLLPVTTDTSTDSKTRHFAATFLRAVTFLTTVLSQDENDASTEQDRLGAGRGEGVDRTAAPVLSANFHTNGLIKRYVKALLGIRVPPSGAAGAGPTTSENVVLDASSETNNVDKSQTIRFLVLQQLGKLLQRPDALAALKRGPPSDGAIKPVRKMNQQTPTDFGLKSDVLTFLQEEILDPLHVHQEHQTRSDTPPHVVLQESLVNHFFLSITQALAAYLQRFNNIGRDLTTGPAQQTGVGTGAAVGSDVATRIISSATAASTISTTGSSEVVDDMAAAAAPPPPALSSTSKKNLLNYHFVAELCGLYVEHSDSLVCSFDKFRIYQLFQQVFGVLNPAQIADELLFFYCVEKATLGEDGLLEEVTNTRIEQDQDGLLHKLSRVEQSEAATSSANDGAEDDGAGETSEMEMMPEEHGFQQHSDLGEQWELQGEIIVTSIHKSRHLSALRDYLRAFVLPDKKKLTHQIRSLLRDMSTLVISPAHVATLARVLLQLLPDGENKNAASAALLKVYAEELTAAPALDRGYSEPDGAVEQDSIRTELKFRVREQGLQPDEEDQEDIEICYYWNNKKRRLLASKQQLDDARFDKKNRNPCTSCLPGRIKFDPLRYVEFLLLLARSTMMNTTGEQVLTSVVEPHIAELLISFADRHVEDIHDTVENWCSSSPEIKSSQFLHSRAGPQAGKVATNKNAELRTRLLFARFIGADTLGFLGRGLTSQTQMSPRDICTLAKSAKFSQLAEFLSDWIDRREFEFKPNWVPPSSNAAPAKGGRRATGSGTAGTSGSLPGGLVVTQKQNKRGRPPGRGPLNSRTVRKQTSWKKVGTASRNIFDKNKTFPHRGGRGKAVLTEA